MKRIKELHVVMSLLPYAVLVCGVLIAVYAALRVLSSMNSDIAVAIIGAAAMVVVSVVSVFLQKYYESRALIQREHREKKIPVYESLMKFMFGILMSTKSGNKPNEKEVIEFMSDFNQRIMVWGSDDVLAAWVKWRRAATGEEKADSLDVMLLYEQLILTIRRDLGHRNRNLGKGDVLAIFVNDIDQAINGA